MHVVRILVQGIGVHAVVGEADDHARFQESIQEVSDALMDQISPAELLVHGASVLNTLEAHTCRTTSGMQFQTVELQNMVKMLTSAVGVVSAVSNVNISRLSEIDNQVAAASKLDDVRMIKAKLSDCLVDIRKEFERQQKETGETIRQLTQCLEEARKHSRNLLETATKDPVTGLPLRPEAEAALAEPGLAGSQAYAAVLVLDRLHLAASRVCECFPRRAPALNKVSSACRRSVTSRVSLENPRACPVSSF
jgi:hypothetical protein